MEKTSTTAEPKNYLIGYRIKIKSEKLPFERYVADIGTVTSPLYAKIFDQRSAKQKAFDLELARWKTEIEPVYGSIKEGRNSGTSDNN